MEHLAAEGYTVVDLHRGARAARRGDAAAADDRPHVRRRLRRRARRGAAGARRRTASGRPCSSPPASPTAGCRFPWYERQPPVLGWDEIVELDRRRDAALRGPHGLASQPAVRRRRDARAPRSRARRRELEPRLGRPVSAFAYPAGLFGERERRLVAEAGYAAAVSLRAGRQPPDTDRFALRRRQIDRARPPARLPGQGRRRSRHAAAAARRLPAAALRQRRGTPRGPSSRA